MLIGVTGFIGKVWLANTLLDLPDVKTHLSADPPAEVESGGAPLREDGGRFAGLRSACLSATVTGSSIFCATKSKSSKATSPSPVSD